MNKTPENIYGYGILKNVIAVGRDSMLPLPKENIQKDVIYTNPNMKLDSSKGQNYFKDYMNDPVSKQNYDEAEDYSVDQGIKFLEALPNINLDTDGDGLPDMVLGQGLLQGNQAEKATEVQEEMKMDVVEVEQPKIEEESIEKKEVEKPLIESTTKLQNIDNNTNVQPNRQNKLNDTNSKSFNISASEGVVLGAGALSLALMAFGKSAAK